MVRFTLLAILSEMGLNFTYNYKETASDTELNVHF